VFLICCLLLLLTCSTREETTFAPYFFTVTADMREFTGDNPDYFRGACEAIREVGAGAFMISPGDIDPPWQTLETIQKYIAPDHIWYTVIGNHESETPADMAWLREYNQGVILQAENLRHGPQFCEETTYSFDFQHAHFVVLNQYYDGLSDTGTDGDVVDGLYDWLREDLTNNRLGIVFILGHEPAYPQPDSWNGRMRHGYDSLNAHPANRDRFWNLLAEFKVTAYICGHTHNYSAVNIGGVWQIDVGHARGTGDPGAPSTFVRIDLDGVGGVSFTTYRLDHLTGQYRIFESMSLN
jgi:hypothetical protein